MEKVLVTGANGFIGSHLVEGLLKKGYPVRALVRKTSNLRWLTGLEVELVYGEVTDYASLLAAVGGVEYVFHLASTTRVTKKSSCDFVNCGGTKNLLEACGRRGRKLKRFIFFSSQAAVGPGSNCQPVDERTQPKPVSFYGLSKLAGERLVLAYRDRLPVVILRPPAIYGPRDTDTLELLRWVKAGIRPFFGGRDSRLSLCFVDDLVRASVAAIEKPVASGSIFFISDGVIYSYHQVYQRAEAVLGVRAVPLPVSAALVALYTRFHPDSPLTRDKARELLHGNWICDPTKAKRELGFEPKVFLHEGLRRTIDWYQKSGWL